MDNNVKEFKIPRMRTVKEAASEMKALDKDTAMTEWHIRQLAIQGILPRVRAGKKYLINLDLLYEYLENPEAEKFKQHSEVVTNGIRKIV